MKVDGHVLRCRRRCVRPSRSRHRKTGETAPRGERDIGDDVPRWRQRAARRDRAVELRGGHVDKARGIETGRARAEREGPLAVEIDAAATGDLAASRLRAQSLHVDVAADDRRGERERHVGLPQIGAHDLFFLRDRRGDRARQARGDQCRLNAREIDVGERQIELRRAAGDRQRDLAGRTAVAGDLRIDIVEHQNLAVPRETRAQRRDWNAPGIECTRCRIPRRQRPGKAFRRRPCRQRQRQCGRGQRGRELREIDVAGVDVGGHEQRRREGREDRLGGDARFAERALAIDADTLERSGEREIRAAAAKLAVAFEGQRAAQREGRVGRHFCAAFDRAVVGDEAQRAHRMGLRPAGVPERDAGHVAAAVGGPPIESLDADIAHVDLERQREARRQARGRMARRP